MKNRHQLGSERRELKLKKNTLTYRVELRSRSRASGTIFFQEKNVPKGLIGLFTAAYSVYALKATAGSNTIPKKNIRT